MTTLLWQQISNSTVTELLCTTKMDGIVLDCEHGYFNPETLVDCIRVIRMYKKKALVRVREDDVKTMQLAYDNNCWGIVVANVRRTVMSSMGTGLCQANSYGVHYNTEGVPDVTRQSIKWIGQVESLRGIELAKDYPDSYDYYMIGMYDLSVDCGCGGDFKASVFLDKIDIFNASIPREKRGIHLVKNIHNDIEKYESYGLKCFSLDTLAILDMVKGLDNYV